GYPQRFPKSTRIYTLLEKYSFAQRPYCLYTSPTHLNPNCILGAKNANSRRALMIGDSFSNHYWQFMTLLAKKANVSVLAHSTGGCLSLPEILQYDWDPINRGVYKLCRDQTKLYYKMIKENHYDFVILGQAWQAYLQKGIVNKEDDQQSL